MKSASGFILSLIGGILNIFIGFLGILLSILLILVITGLDLNSGVSSMADFSVVLVLIFIFLSLWFIVSGIFAIIFSVKINNDVEVRKGAIGCLIFGLLSINLLLVIGSILGFSASKKFNSEKQIVYLQ